MKPNWLVILIILFVGSAINIKELLNFDNPDIKIKEINVIETDSVKFYCYTINLYSPSQLRFFAAQPSKEGINKDSQVKIHFNSHTRRATIVYYYAMSIKESEDINIKFCLNDNAKQIDSTVYPIGK